MSPASAKERQFSYNLLLFAIEKTNEGRGKECEVNVKGWSKKG
jgi:hypothetical protein